MTMTRETWMNAVAERMRPMFAAVGAPLPERFRVTMSLTKGKKTIGTCFDSTASADGVNEILIRLDRHEPVDVAQILTHELVHAAVGIPAGHGPKFKAVATKLGLEGPMTATTAGDSFKSAIAPILAEVGPFPHAPLDWSGKRSGPKKQTTRLLKVYCEECGYVARATSKWIDTSGAPHCPEHGEMMVEGEEGSDD